MDFSKRLNDLMKLYGYEQKHIRERADIKRGTLNDIVHGKNNNPSLNTIQLLAKAFNMTLADFLTEDNEAFVLIAEGKKFIVYSKNGKVNKQEQDHLESTIKMLDNIPD